jgi:hypothetical protein
MKTVAVRRQRFDARSRALTVDGVAILVFATIGQLSHHGGVSATGYAEAALPLLLGWFAAAAAFRGRFLPTWFVGTTLGVAIRMVALSHYRASEAAFWLVALVFVGTVAWTGRAAVAALLHRWHGADSAT